MADLVYVGILVAFFALAALFVKSCDRLVGQVQSEPDVDTEPADDNTTEVAA